MNRAQRRKAGKVDQNNFRQLMHQTDAKIEKNMVQFEDEIRTATQNHFMGLMYCVFTLVLRKCCKYGPLRTLRVLQEVAAIVNDLENGIITVFDLKRDAEDVGIKIVFDAEYNIIEAGIFEEDKYENIRKKADQERMKLYKETNYKGLRLWTNPLFDKQMLKEEAVYGK